MKPESWNSRFGAILAVAGSAVGLGNFLKFPGQVAMYGGASFMLAYVVSFFLLGRRSRFASGLWAGTAAPTATIPPPE